MFPNIHSLEESIQFLVFGIIIFTKFQRRQPSRFLLGGKRLSPIYHKKNGVYRPIKLNVAILARTTCSYEQNFKFLTGHKET